MDIDALRELRDEREQVNQLYNLFHEETRLTRSQSAQVEFRTTVRYAEQFLFPGARILDLGAGTGIYSLYFAEKGFSVDALELADRNVALFRERLRPDLPVRLRQGSAVDLAAYAGGVYDVVLLMGPLYHLHDAADRAACLREARRVLKPDGVLFASFIHHDMVFMTELGYDGGYFHSGDYDRETMRLHDFPFVFFTVDECRTMLREAGFTIEREIASDGASELMAAQIDAMDDADYAQYLKYHFLRCEKPEMLGFSSHLLFAAKKQSGS